MHAAPSVSYPVGRSAFAGALAAALALLGLAVAGLWLSQSAAAGWRQALGLAAVAAFAVLAAAGWLRSPAGVLRWDGAGWQWQQDGTAAPGGRPEVALDLQSRMLLRWQPAGGRARWFWLERQSDSAHWEALRRAVYSRASAPIPSFSRGEKETSPAGDPPAAEQ